MVLPAEAVVPYCCWLLRAYGLRRNRTSAARPSLRHTPLRYSGSRGRAFLPCSRRLHRTSVYYGSKLARTCAAPLHRVAGTMDALLGGPLTRWHAASAGAFLEANAGLQYVFGDVSGSLRSQLGYTQRQIDGLGTAKDCGTAVVDVMAGFMFDAFGAPTTLVFIAVRAATSASRGFALGTCRRAQRRLAPALAAARVE